MRRKHAFVASIITLALMLIMLVGLRPDALDQIPDSSHEKTDEPAVAPLNQVQIVAGTESVSDSIREPAGPVSSGATVEDPLQTWSDAPDIVETMVLAEIQQMNLSATTIDPIECTATECQIRYIVSQGSCDIGTFQSFREPPISAVFIGSTGRYTATGWECRFTLYSSFQREQTTDPGKALRRRAATLLDPDDYNAAPVRVLVIMAEKTSTIMAENVCTYDCASDGRQMIYILGPEDATCTELGGIEQRFMARTSIGGLEERTFCVPNALVGE